MIELIKYIAKKVGRLWLLFLTLFTSNLFLVYSPEGMVTFKLSGITIPKNSAVYMTYEHVGYIIMAWIIANPPTEHKYMYKLFLWLGVIDFFFFTLYYKSPVLWNPLKCAIFGVPLIYETWKSLRQHYHNT